MKSCSCSKCVVACETKPGVLSPRDLERLPHDKLAASEGTKMLCGDGTIKHVLTIVPAQQDNGHCVFLQNGLCTVHDNKPFGCKQFNACDSQDAMDAAHKMQRLYTSIAASSEYAEVWKTLPAAAPIADRAAAFSAAIDLADRKSKKKRFKGKVR